MFSSPRFDADLSACKEDATSEVQAKEQLAREKDLLHTEYEELKAKLKVSTGSHTAPLSQYCALTHTLHPHPRAHTHTHTHTGTGGAAQTSGPGEGGP